MKKVFFILFLTFSFLFFQKAGTTPVITIGEITLQFSPGDFVFSEEMLSAYVYMRSSNQDERELCDGTDDEENLDDDGNQITDEDGVPIGDTYKSCPAGEGYTTYAEYIAAVGYAEAAANGVDCRDNDLDINPGADEVCDGKDNNCDGVIDNDDPGVYCKEIDHADERECEDEDGDEIDCEEEYCSDGVDQDDDGSFDCDDVADCGATDVCTESGIDEAATEAAGEDAADVDECSDGDDDDADGFIDCKDDDCATDPACLEQDTECSNGIDDDGDADTTDSDTANDDYIDCGDPDCAGSEACIETGSTECSNSKDDDGDGLENCDDPDCADETVCEPQNLDDDGDGYTEAQGDDDDTNDKLWFTAGSLDEDNDGDGYSENNGDCDDTSTTYSPVAYEICDDEDNEDENCDGVALTHEDFGKSADFDMSTVEYLEDDDGLKCISADFVPLTEVPPSCSFHIE